MEMKNCLIIMETQTQWDCSTLWNHLTKMVKLIKKGIGSKGFEPVAFAPFKQCPLPIEKKSLSQLLDKSNCFTTTKMQKFLNIKNAHEHCGIAPSCGNI